MKKWLSLSMGVCLVLFFFLVQPGLAQKKGGTFTFSAAADLKNLDLHKSVSGGDYEVMSVSVETLVGPNELGEPTPCLAESWESSNNATEWTFHLRKGVKFHNGREMTADDVKWNIDRIMNPQTTAARKSSFDMVKSVTVIDRYTIKFSLKRPFAAFLSSHFENTGPQASILAPESLNNDGTITQPIGTGPFKFVEWKVGQEVILEANTDYWDKANMPKVQRVVIRNIKDSSQRLAALKAGEIHGMEGLNPDDVKVVRSDPNLQVLLRPTNTTGYVAFNYKVKEFQDRRIRLAVAHAINKKAIVDALYGGTGMVATQFQPPPLWGHNKDLKDFAYSQQQTRDLLKEAGFPQGLKEITWEDGRKEPLQFWYMPVSRPYYPNPKEIAEAMAADLAKAGITAQLQTVDWTTYLDKRKNGQLPLYMLGWTGDNGDPDNFVCYFFCNPGASREGFYANPGLAEVLLQAQKQPDQSKRAELYRRAEQIIHDDVARIFIANNQPPLAFSKKVQGYVANPTGSEYFNTVHLQ